MTKRVQERRTKNDKQRAARLPAGVAPFSSRSCADQAGAGQLDPIRELSALLARQAAREWIAKQANSRGKAISNSKGIGLAESATDPSDNNGDFDYGTNDA